MNNYLQPSWRWFGPNEAVTLAEVRQAGVTGVVTALHDIPCGETWPVTAIMERKKLIENVGLVWNVVESVNVHESIKTASKERDVYINNYQQTLKNLAECGIHTVCYNFMPVLDWTRTHLSYQVLDGSYALRYDAIALVAFELYLLKRKGAEENYAEEVKSKAQAYINSLTKSEQATLQQTIMAGLPGTDEVFTPEEFRKHLEVYKEIDAARLRENLIYFLNQIMPIAGEYNVKMCIHPDDPPFPILGLPRIVCNENDLKTLMEAVPSYHNGITFCTGSLGGRGDNDLPGMIERLGDRIHFLHLRNVQREDDGSFYEADHLAGSTDMYAVMKAVINEQQKRQANNRNDIAIPMRPDHGHQYLFDKSRKFYPGYSGVGRLRGLAELRGLEMGIRRSVYEL